MRKIYKLLFPLIVALGLLSPFSAKATHVMGADIEWKCLGNDTFEIIVHAYRDCNGIPLSGTDLTYQSSDGNCTSGAANANPSVCCGTDITPVCNSSCDRCKDLSCDFAYGIQIWTITAIVYLPPPCCDYTFAWQECCRNGAITTGAANDNFYDEVYCNRCVKPCDNSPYFTNPPVGIFCVNQCVVYNPAGNDIDRDADGRADSLVYSFGNPTSGAGSDIGYISPYTSTTPLQYSGSDPNAPFVPPFCNGFHLDSTTGDIEFKATKTDVTVFVIVVDEYRRDSLGIERKIGEVKRDLQIAIIDCPANNPPIIPGINGGNQYSEKICADKQTCFNIKAFDLDAPDTDFLAWTDPGTMNGATFTVVPDGKKWPTATFCWFPTDKDVRSYPYTFVVTALDNHCPVPGRSIKAFQIYVIASPQAVYSATIGNCGRVSFQASVAPNSATTITNYTWVGEAGPGFGPLYIIGRTGTYQYNRPGLYHYTLVVSGPNGCTRNYTDSVKIPPFVGISLPKDTFVCNNGPTITVNATLIDAKKPYAVWFWGGKDSVAGSSITQKITGDTTFVVHIKDATGCTNFDSMKVTANPLPVPNLGPPRRGCWGHPVLLSTGLKKHMPVANWTQIKGKDTFRNILHGDTVEVIDSGTWSVTVQDSIGCPGTGSVDVFYNPYVKARSGDTTVCYGDSVHLTAGQTPSSTPPGTSIKWIDQIHANKILSTSNVYSFRATGIQQDFEIVLSYTAHGVTCVDTGKVKVIVNTPSHPQFKDTVTACIYDPPVDMTSKAGVDQAHLGGLWYYPTNPNVIVNGYLYPNVLGSTQSDPGGFVWVYYKYYNQFKCITIDSDKVYITKRPVGTAGPDTTICTGNGLYPMSGFANPTGGTWFPLTGTPRAALFQTADTLYFDPNAVGVADTVYGVIYSWKGLGKATTVCSNSDTVFIRVRTNPKVTVPLVDSLCINASPRELQPQPTGGIWTIAPGDNTNPSALIYDKSTQYYSFDPSVAGPGKHYLQYTAYGDRQRTLCPTTMIDSVYVVPPPKNVNYTTQMNGDTGIWDFCVKTGTVELVPSINGKRTFSGSFSPTLLQSEVYNIGSQYYFRPTAADTVDSAKNTIEFILPYNNGGCQVTLNHQIKVDGRPWVHINQGAAACQGTASSAGFEIKATAKNFTKLLWSTDDPKNTNFSYLNPDGTDVLFFPDENQKLLGKFTIFLEAVNNGQCPGFNTSQTFRINDTPVVVFNSDQVGCEPLAVHFQSDGTKLDGTTVGLSSFDWDFGDGSAHSSDQNPYHVYTVTNGKDTQQFNVRLTVATDSGCVAFVQKNQWITVYATPKPVIGANPQYTTVALPQIQFNLDQNASRGIDFGSPNTTYLWSFGDSSHQTSTVANPTHTYADTGKFKVTIHVSSKGCTGDTSIYVYVQPELIIYIPNVFKPDNMHGQNKVGSHEPNYFSAEVNNTFQPVVSGYASFEMDVYNRWGQLMYTTYDPNKGWDGHFQGHDPLQDVYVYVIKATGYSGKTYTFTGTVTLLD